MLIGLFVLVTFTFGVEDPEPFFRGVLLGIGVIAASWLLGARTRQARLAASARTRAEERLNLARDVDDVLSHSLGTIGVLAGVNAHVAALTEASLRTTLRDIEATARSGMVELKALLQRERDTDPALADATVQQSASHWSVSQGLASIARIAATVGLQATLHAPAGLDALPAAVRTTVYRIVQEAVTNVVRHAAARFVTISVHATDSGAAVQVSDDGCGRVAALREGHGLTGMRERVSLLGGTVAIEDRDGGGLTVSVTLPVADPAWQVGQ